MDATNLNANRRPFSIKLWPPSQNTRQMLVERMTTNLSTKSIFTQKYGTLDKEEAEEQAKRIENVAFTTAGEQYEKEPDGDGASAVQLYAKECSKLLLEVLKQGPSKNDKLETVSADYVTRTVGTILDTSKGQQAIIAGEEVQGPSKDDRMGTLPADMVTRTVEKVFDLSKGQRSLITGEEAEELLSPLKQQGNSFTKICFSNKSFGLDAANVAKPILVSLKDKLKEVDLSDFIAGRQEEEALQVMTIFSIALEGSALKSLNLSNNALGEKGVRAFGDLLKSQTCLEELYLMNDGISEEAAKAVCELIPSTEKLRVLHFHNNMTGDEGAFAISEMVKRSTLLEDFRCSSTRIGSEGGVALAEALENCPHIKKLDLRDNMFGLEVGVALSKALLKHTWIKEVYLSYLNLEDDGATAIAEVLKDSAPHLEVLEMSGNDITVEAAPAIAACIAAKQQLTKLNLSENELKDDGTILLGKALEGLAKLQEVDFSSNLIRRAGARLLARTVVHKPGFKLLNIDGNFISDEGIDEVRDIFRKSPDLLGPLDENDPEGDENGEDSGEEETNEDELGSKLENLEVNQE